MASLHLANPKLCPHGDLEPQLVAIAGAGVLGLTCAYLLTEAGYGVTIVARNLPGDKSTEWASPWAGALLAPHPDSGFPELQVESLKAYQAVAEKEPASGVKKLNITEYYDDRPQDAEIWYESSMPDFRRISPSELPAGTTLGFAFSGMVVNPTQFLPWISEKLKNRGVRFIRKTLSSTQDLYQLTGADVLVNASGLGAEQLVPDKDVVGIRGQTMFVRCESLNHAILRQGSQYTYVIPRPSDGGVILGGVTQPGDQRAEPDRSLRRDILGLVNEMTKGAFRWVNLERDVADIVGFRPARKGGICVKRDGQIIHAYGAGGLGYLYAFGIARKVRDLISDVPKARL
ncbi:hypothetical protein F5883DRAFT_634101 [Diaporthe sp. PMI_573]|nr:hypothetical protein F5883DRAFT_634101 [Diaporthaceae sp. PMI_573]